MDVEITLFIVVVYDIDVQAFDSNFCSFGFKDAYIFLLQCFFCYKKLESLVELLGLDLEKERVIAEFVIFLMEGFVKVRDFGYVLRNVEIVVFGLTNVFFEDGNAIAAIVRIIVDIIAVFDGNELAKILVTESELS